MENDQTPNQTPNQSLIRAQDAAKLPAQYYPAPESLGYLRETEEEDSINLLDYWRVLVKRRWTILTITFAVLIVTAIATWKSTPIYRSTIKIQIDPEQTNVLPFKDTVEPTASYAQSQDYLQTQFKILESKTLAERVIRTLNLDKNPSFVGNSKPTAKSKVVEWANGLLGDKEEESEKNADPDAVGERRMDRLTKVFARSLSTAPIRNSRLVDVSFESPDPKLAADVANKLATEYIDLNFDTKYKATTTATDWLEDKMVNLKSNVEKSEEELVRFSQNHDIYEISEKENVILQKLADLNTALTAAQADRIQRESVWNIVHQAGPGNFPDVLRNELIKGLEANLAALKVQQAKLAASFKPGWPELDQIAGQVAEAETQLAAERQKAIKNIETEYKTAVQRESLLSKALAEQKMAANSYNQNSIQYNIIKRQVDANKQLYDGLLQRMKEAGVAAGLKSNNIHIVDPARPQPAPFKPNKTLNLSLALALGLLLGVGMAFFCEHLDSSIKTPDDIDRYIKLPSLGVIPSAASMIPPSRRKLLAVPGGDSKAKTAQQKSIELITYHDTKSLVSEAYRSLRTSVLLSSGSGRPPKVLLVTSSQAGEGKTTTAVNIAITLSQTGEKVILLDCDMRNPRVHRVIGLENAAGMSTFLSGNSDLSSLIQQSEIPNLFAVPAGRIPPNPAELLGSARMKQGLALLDEYFDHIVIDSPPVLSVTDARIIGTLVDGVVLVIKGGETPKEAVQRTKRLLQEVHAHVIGTLLNNVDVRSADYYYYSKYYYYGYGKKYGYGYGYGVKPDQKEEANS
jgi:polysaccharide biosynthesis transport protein